MISFVNSLFIQALKLVIFYKFWTKHYLCICRELKTPEVLISFEIPLEVSAKNTAPNNVVTYTSSYSDANLVLM